MSRIVDARGLACPQPVILTRKALQESDELVVIVDNETSRQNVSRMAEKSGYTVQSETRPDGIYLHITKGGQLEAPAKAAAAKPAQGPLVLAISQDRMGHGDQELGSILIGSFFHTLNEMHPLPQTIIFFNSGVYLVVEGSPVLQDLQALQAQGVQILACGTCLGHFGLKEKVAVGEVSNMYTIAETLLGAGKVVNL
ncbi:MAG: sulfurtransferase-like selenium metabolism protein YedF [bacterium]|jgi:selenium metabolism protein YedF|nr:sulfurtransferase-like selenium metabolism protein YedF [candidate division KSB1 bacterium]MDH7561618.1 sulfurtransferase-like selenium metabolism protein YedF [bacterium]